MMSDGTHCRWVYRTVSEQRLLRTFVYIRGLAGGYTVGPKR